MADFPWGSVISAGSDLIGGFMGKSASAAAVGSAERQASEWLNFQKDLAQHGIRWKVEDAMRAGVHPLFALGAPPFNASPIMAQVSPDMSMANAVSSMGQNIGRAIDATRTQEERVNAHVQKMQALQLESMALDNEHKRQLIATTWADRLGPPFPDPHSGRNPAFVDSGPPTNSGQSRDPMLRGSAAAAAGGRVEDVPLQRVAPNSATPQQEPGAITSLGFARSKSGWEPVPSGDVKQRIEDMLVSELMWEMKNRVGPTFGMNLNPPFKAPRGKHWVYHPFRGEYQLRDNGSDDRWVHPVD